MSEPGTSADHAKRLCQGPPDESAPGPSTAVTLPQDVSDIIVDILLSTKDRFYDAADLCSVAAACMLVGSRAFAEFGEAIYHGLSPRLGTQLDVSENSSIPELKRKCKVRVTSPHAVRALAAVTSKPHQ